MKKKYTKEEIFSLHARNSAWLGAAIHMLMEHPLCREGFEPFALKLAVKCAVCGGSFCLDIRKTRSLKIIQRLDDYRAQVRGGRCCSCGKAARAAMGGRHAQKR